MFSLIVESNFVLCIIPRADQLVIWVGKFLKKLVKNSYWLKEDKQNQYTCEQMIQFPVIIWFLFEIALKL